MKHAGADEQKGTEKYAATCQDMRVRFLLLAEPFGPGCLLQPRKPAGLITFSFYSLTGWLIV